MGKTPQLLVTACLGYFVAVACSGAGGGGGAMAGAGGTAWATGSAGAGLGIDVPDAAAAGAAGGCGCEAREPTVVVGTCSPSPLAGYVECSASFPGKTAVELMAVRVFGDVSACAYPQSCGTVKQQMFAGYAAVAAMAASQVGVQPGKVSATFPDGVPSATFVLP